MAINSVASYLAAARQRFNYVKTGARTTVAGQWFSAFDLAGQPGAGTLNIGNTANGVVPDDSVAGYPIINAFGAGAEGRLTKVDFGSSVACRIALYDRLFAAGAYAFNANTTLASVPSFAARVPDANYTGLELWVETVTAPTGNQAVSVGYTNQSGTAGRSTGAVGIGAAPTVGRCWQLPLQAGDSGLQSIQSIVGSGSSAGASVFNVMVLRPLWTGRVRIPNDGGNHGILDMGGGPTVYAGSALYVMVNPDSTALGVPEMQLQISNG